MLHIKKILVLFALFVLAVSMTFGQVRFGVQGGIGISNLIYKMPLDDPFDPTLVFHGGAMVEFGAIEGLAFGTGLMLTGKGGQQTMDFEQYSLNMKFRPYYLEVPAKIILHGRGVYGAVGPYAAYGIFGKEKVKLSPKIDEIDKMEYSRNLKFGNGKTNDFTPFEYGLLLEFGYESPMGVRILLKYQNGLSDMLPSKFSEEEGVSKVHNYTLGLSVAYMFNYAKL